MRRDRNLIAQGGDHTKGKNFRPSHKERKGTRKDRGKNNEKLGRVMRKCKGEGGWNSIKNNHIDGASKTTMVFKETGTQEGRGDYLLEEK